MTHLNVFYIFLTLSGFSLGGWHLCWARCDHNSVRGLWARRLAFSALLLLGVAGLVAAGLRSAWLVPLGLLAGFMIVVMLWEGSESSLNSDNAGNG